MPGRRITLVAALALAALLLASCGGEEEPAPDRPDEIENAEPGPELEALIDDPFVAADRFCSEAGERQEEVRAGTGAERGVGGRARLLGELAPSRAELAEQLAGLAFPEEVGDAPAELVDAARRRAEASAEAAQRWEQGKPPRRIAAAAARENAERAIFVEVARELELEDCGERLSPPQEREASLTAIRALIGAPARRCAIYSARLIEQEFGSRAQCRRSRPLVPRPDEVEVRNADGMNNVFAHVRLDTDEGPYRVRLTWENGGYRVDRFD